MTEKHTYADGSQRVGCPPFPKLSPKEEHEAALRGDASAGESQSAEAPAEAQAVAPRRGRPAKAKGDN